MVSLGEVLFAPCARYERDADFAFRAAEEPSCVDCRWQYEPGRVCPIFEKRLQQADGLSPQRTKPREVEP